MLYNLLQWLHVLAAIVAVGSNATYAVWLARSAARPETLPFTLRTIKFLDDRIANPSYGSLLVTGLLMVWVSRLQLTTPWLLTALVLYATLVLLGLFGYTPTLRQQIQVAESEGPQSANYQAVARRGLTIGLLLAVIAVAIVYLMVAKPALWA